MEEGPRANEYPSTKGARCGLALLWQAFLYFLTSAQWMQRLDCELRVTTPLQHGMVPSQRCLEPCAFTAPPGSVNEQHRLRSKLWHVRNSEQWERVQCRFASVTGFDEALRSFCERRGSDRHLAWFQRSTRTIFTHCLCDSNVMMGCEALLPGKGHITEKAICSCQLPPTTAASLCWRSQLIVEWAVRQDVCNSVFL